MNLKYLKYGEGEAKKAAIYLMQEKDHKGVVRAGIEVLRGDPFATAEVADSLGFKYRYSSAVIGFHKGDDPTDEQINEVIDWFEKVAFSGMDPEQYSYSVIKHTEDDGNCHLHILISRVELRTGKSFNTAPPKSIKTFNTLRNYFNEKYGWKSPDIEMHPENAREVQPGGWDFINKKGHPKTIIKNSILDAVKSGEINTRKEMIGWLKQKGSKVERINKFGFTVVAPKKKGRNKWRMRGNLFDENFSAERTLAEKIDVDPVPNIVAANKYKKEMDASIKKRAAYNIINYPAPKVSKYKPHKPRPVSFTGKHGNDEKNKIMNRNKGYKQKLVDDMFINKAFDYLGDIKFVDKEKNLISFTDGGNLEVSPEKLTARNMTTEAAAERIVRGGIAQGWESIILTGSREFFLEAAKKAQAVGLEVEPANLRQRKLLDELKGRSLKVEASTEIERLIKRNKEEVDCFVDEIDLGQYLRSQGYVDKTGGLSSLAVMLQHPKTKHEVIIKDHRYQSLLKKDKNNCGSLVDFLRKNKNMGHEQIVNELKPYLESNRKGKISAAPALLNPSSK